MVDIKAAVGALRADAGIWDVAAQDVDGPRQGIGALGLTPYDVSMYGVDSPALSIITHNAAKTA